MNALAIWIVVPTIAAIALYSIRRWERLVHVAGLCIAFILAWLAWQLPIGETLSLRLGAGFPSLKVAESLTFLGQRFVLSNSNRPVIMLIYLGVGFWLGGAYLARVDRLFVSLSLAISALQVAALAAETGWHIPFILELIAIVTVPLLSPPGKSTSFGAIRFITFQTIGVCLIIFSERWWLGSLNTMSNIDGLPVPLLVMGVGYTLILAVFPFHTWVSMSVEEIDPYTAAFIFYILPTGVCFLMLKNLDSYLVMGAPPILFAGLRGLGVLMVMVGGMWAAFERHLGRILAFTALTQTGVLLLALGLNNATIRNPLPAGILFSQLIPMCIGLALWALALRIIQLHAPDLQIDSARGFARSMPIAAFSLLLAQFSLSGLPLLASFPIYTAIWSMLGQHSLRGVLFFIIGIAFLFAASLRTLASLTTRGTATRHLLPEGKLHSVVLILGCAILLVQGLAPQWFSLSLSRLAGIFMGVNP